jgi:hypothetical protein
MVWYHIFSDCLTCLVEEALKDALVDELLDSQGKHYQEACFQEGVRGTRVVCSTEHELTRTIGSLVEAFLVPRMLQCLSDNSRRVIDIDMSCLVRDMVDQIERFYAYTDMSIMVGWSSSAGGLWSFLHTFLRNQDCLLETTEGFHIIIDFDTTYSASVFRITGHASWHTPNVKFLNLPASLPGGQEYRIVPSIPSHNLIECSSGSDYFPDDVRFKVSCSRVPDMHWDVTEQCFRALIPDHTKFVSFLCSSD